MNLQELQENKKSVIVKRALREHYEIDVAFEKLNLKQTQKMLGNVRGLIKEARVSKSVHQSQNNAAYLKLVMMEQALSDRLNDLRVERARIVVENEEVQKSQVILAAQDMVDSLQKMLEQISKMNVEELNAVVTGMKNEFGSEQGDQFNAAASQSLSTLQQALTTAKNEVASALGAVTGEGPAMSGDMGGMSGVDMGMEPGAELDANADVSIEEPMPSPDEEEPESLASAGREFR